MKKQILRTKISKNPLSLVFGLVLRNLRAKNAGMPSDELARRLGLSSSNYRLLEAGATSLQASRAIKLIQAFGEIEFNCLASFLVVCDIFWAPDLRIEEIRDHLKELHLLVPEMRNVFSSLGQVMDEHLANPESDLRTKIEQRYLPESLYNFLQGKQNASPLEGNKNITNRLATIVHSVSPLFLDSMTHSMEALERVTLRFSPLELFAFEQKNADRFRKIVGIVRSPDMFINSPCREDRNNLTVWYPYLWHSTFERLVVYYVDGCSPSVVRKRFQDNLFAALSRNSIKYTFEIKHFDEGVSKISVIKIPDLDLQDVLLNQISSAVLSKNDDPMNNLWIYYTPLWEIAIIDNVEGAFKMSGCSTLFAEVLTFPETQKRITVLEQLPNF